MADLTLEELTFQLCQLEAALEIRLGDLPASQIIRTATRRLELQRRQIEQLESENVHCVREIQRLEAMNKAALEAS